MLQTSTQAIMLTNLALTGSWLKTTSAHQATTALARLNPLSINPAKLACITLKRPKAHALFVQLAATALEEQTRLAQAHCALPYTPLFLIGQLFVLLATSVKQESMLRPLMLTIIRISHSPAQKEVMEAQSV